MSRVRRLRTGVGGGSRAKKGRPGVRGGCEWNGKGSPAPSAAFAFRAALPPEGFLRENRRLLLPRRVLAGCRLPTKTRNPLSLSAAGPKKPKAFAPSARALAQAKRRPTGRGGRRGEKASNSSYEACKVLRQMSDSLRAAPLGRDARKGPGPVRGAGHRAGRIE